MIASHLLFAVYAFFSSLSFTIAAPVSFQRRNSRWDYENDTIHGVNLGGWLVLEPYIAPSLFEAFGTNETNIPVDEYHLTMAYGKEKALEVLSNHWETFYTEDDFAKMQQYGLNMVRIPIGYWAFASLRNDPFVQGQVEYLDKALAWCKKYNLKAWIDLHGAPGSQNAFDNSGLRDYLDWQTHDYYYTLTYSILGEIAKKYSTPEYDDVVIGIQLVNEPFGPKLDREKIIEFYNNGYDIVRKAGDVPVIIHDAFFQLDYSWDKVLNTELNPYVWDVVLDHHHYQVFTVPELQRSVEEHVAYACHLGEVEGKEYHYTLCGEWTAALTDCAKWLNGVNRGSRYGGTYQNDTPVGSCDNFYTGDSAYFQNEEVRQKYRKYVEGQMDAYTHKKMNGWVFWCWKTETLIEWDFHRLVELNIIPQPLDSREFPNQCGFE